MIKRVLILLLLGSFGVGPVRAQESAASLTFKQHLRGQYLQNDTAQAIINLYSRRQAGGAGWILSSLLAATRVATASNTTTVSNGYVVRNERPDIGVALLFTLPFSVYGAGKIVHYSNGKLDRLLADYAAGKPLARSLRRKLKPRFFAQPIIEYQSVKVQPVK